MSYNCISHLYSIFHLLTTSAMSTITANAYADAIELARPKYQSERIELAIQQVEAIEQAHPIGIADQCLANIFRDLIGCPASRQAVIAARYLSEVTA